MTKLRLLLCLCGLAAFATLTAAAFAARPGSYTCTGGVIPAGTYSGLTVNGNCTFAAGTTTINGNLVVADGAILNDHASSPGAVHVNGNVTVGKGAVLGLGTYNPFGNHGSWVTGNVDAHQPLTLYLSFMTIKGNLSSNGGGGDPVRNFPIKDITVGGNLTIQHWDGFWLGILRDTVAGNVVFSHNAGTNPDTNEVVNNDIGGNLSCQHNSPPAQIGDAEQPASRVGGNTTGECAGL
jgi:hypothetical protein